MDVPSQTPDTQRIIDRLIHEFRQGNTALKIAMGLLAADPTVIQIAPVFFGLTIEGNLYLAQMYAAKMYDSHRAAITINTLIQRCEDEAKTFNHATEAKVLEEVAWCREAVASIQTILRAITKRRNQALAHLDPRFVQDPVAFNTSAALTIPDLVTVFERTDKILQRIDAVHSGTIGGLGYLGPNDYKVVLDLITSRKKSAAGR
jgi:hypothetical protein